MTAPRVFLSYSTKDKEYSDRFVAALRVAQLDVWYAGDDMTYGSTISQVIAPEITKRAVFLILVSRAALSSTYVFDEFSVAHELWLRDKNMPHYIIPVLLEKLELDDYTKGWPFLLVHPHIAGQHGHALTFDETVQRTVRAILDHTEQSHREDVPPPGSQVDNPATDQILPALQTVPTFPSASDTSLTLSDRSERSLVYLLLDTSISMEGEPINAVNFGVRSLYNELVCHLETVQSTSISIITFSNRVEFAPPTSLTAFIPPVVTARNLHSEGGTALGGALQALRDDLVLTSASDNVYIFILTDGEPTDGAQWYPVALELKHVFRERIQAFVGLGCGPNANMRILEQICFESQQMRELTPRAIREYFGWVARRIRLSESTLSDEPGASSTYLALPEGIEPVS